MRNRRQYYALKLLLTDAFILLLVFVLAYIWRVKFDHRPLLDQVYAGEYLAASLLIIPMWLIIFANLGLYSQRIYHTRLTQWSKIILGCGLGLLLIIGWEYVTNSRIMPARLIAVYILINSVIGLICGREIVNLVHFYLNSRNINQNRVLIIGNSPTLTDLVEQIINNPFCEFKIAATACPKKLLNSLEINNCIHYPSAKQALANLESDEITTIIETNLDSISNTSQQILNTALANHLEYKFIPGNPDFYSGKNFTDIFYGYPLISVSPTPLVGWGAIAKRLFDLFLTIITLPIWGALLLIAILLQKIFNPGPVFYVSKRLSQFSKPFDLLKLRSMDAKFGKKDAALEFEEMNRPDLAREYRQNHKVKNDPRITKFGKVLRKTSLDELPQLINVLKGDLSLVGPRPILPQEVKFSKKRSALLHSVRSGVTGLWQVSGRNDLGFNERIELEIFYAQNWSFWMDIKILAKTILVVLSKKGVH